MSKLKSIPTAFRPKAEAKIRRANARQRYIDWSKAMERACANQKPVDNRIPAPLSMLSSHQDAANKRDVPISR